MSNLFALTATICIVVLCFALHVESWRNAYPKLKSYPLNSDDNPGDALFLTPLIEKGKIDEARNRARVPLTEMSDILSYSGYFTVNKKYNSNLFFWFFPAANSPNTSSVVLWLQGGPGASSLFGLFTENGPFSVTSNITLQSRQYSWHVNHNLLYVDNPVGTGYSFTENDEGYARNETQVGREMYIALVQFFKLFPELQKNQFFVTGESYAGKYVPAVSHAIKDFNIKAEMKINLQGLAIGNGLTDPYNQLYYSDYLYQIGLIDLRGKKLFKDYEDQGRNLIEQNKFIEAFEVFDKLLDGDLTSTPSLFKNLTGYDFYYNYLHNKESNDSDWMSKWVQKVDTRRAIHVGNYSFNTESKAVEEHLKNDVMQSLAGLISDLTLHYRVLIYNGQLDIIVAYPLTEHYLQNLNWTRQEEYKSAVRTQWWVDGELAGYSKTAGSLTEVLVRNAGHMVPSDQPKWASDLITRFTENKRF